MSDARASGGSSTGLLPDQERADHLFPEPVSRPCPIRDLYSESDVAELLAQILSAVDYLHGRRVIHLDLRSDNMLVDDGNRLKLVDLGSAQLFTAGQPLTIEHIQGLSESRGTAPAVSPLSPVP